MTIDYFRAVILCELQSTDRKTLSDKYLPSYRDYITLSLYHFLTQFAVYTLNKNQRTNQKTRYGLLKVQCWSRKVYLFLVYRSTFSFSNYSILNNNFENEKGLYSFCNLSVIILC